MENLSAKELRIGNILHDRENRLCKVKEIKEEQFYAPAIKGGITGLPNNAIPLTEQWLIDLGFIRQPFDYTKDKLSVCLKDSDSFHKAGRTYYNSWAIIEKQPTYVHELQNLYFALTGSELEYKKQQS